MVLAFLGLLLLRADAQTERRVALVVGNGIYEEAGTLANPVNDAVDIAARLRDLGFEVIEGNDLGKRALERKIGEFSDALDGAGVGLFYYAGHGLQVDGRNFIVPVDARLDVPAKLRLETVQIDDVLDIMEQQTKTSLVFLDACRNNPFARSLSRTATNRSAVALAGLAQFDSTRGSFIAFSTAPGSVAMDGTGRNSPFASALLRHIGEPGQSINDLMIAVRRDVVSETHDTQRPWEQGSLLERFEFVPSGEPALRNPSRRVSARRRRADAGRRARTFGRRQQVDRALPRERVSCARRGRNPRSREAGLRPVGQDLRLGTRQRRHRQAEDRLVRAIFVLVAAARARQSRGHAARREPCRRRLCDDLRLYAEGWIRGASCRQGARLPRARHERRRMARFIGDAGSALK